ncbi:MAG: prepilin-type N-terminal cleavage/methylation domain-containing protein [Polyangiaceae bacterium]|nr:prepilin-type N-terminal cleavage/methylation domain-containing protein [Polyangiaceae bacterium]
MRSTRRDWKRLRTSRRRSLPGFTLIEMMVVVTIIAMMAALAGPSVIRIIQDRRSQKDALELVNMLQDAHTRAFGRGSAVLVTYTQAPANGVSSIRFTESMQPIDAGGTLDLPNPSCAGTQSAILRYWNPTDREKSTSITMQIAGQPALGAGATQILCFTPRGGTKAWIDPAGPPPPSWVNLTDATQFTVTSTITQNARFVYLYPNGIARLRL